MPNKSPLTIDALVEHSALFAAAQSKKQERSLFGVTDGKAVGTLLEASFVRHLGALYSFQLGSAAKGVDFPDLRVDLKATSIRQPQSSCPFKSAREKVYGLGYSLLVFVYKKLDDAKSRAAFLRMQHVVFVQAGRTGDYQTTRRIRELLKANANEDDIAALLLDRMLPLDEIGAGKLAREILRSPPEQGYLTISNALQWRLQYKRVIAEAGTVDGVARLYGRRPTKKG